MQKNLSLPTQSLMTIEQLAQLILLSISCLSLNFAVGIRHLMQIIKGCLLRNHGLILNRSTIAIIINAGIGGCYSQAWVTASIDSKRFESERQLITHQSRMNANKLNELRTGITRWIHIRTKKLYLSIEELTVPNGIFKPQSQNGID